MRVLVTVGSTQFDQLVQEVLRPDCLLLLQQRGYNALMVQCGKCSLPDLGIPTCLPSGEDGWVSHRQGVAVEIWRFKPSLAQDYANADLIISHAGSGTILEVLRLGKPLIVVPNPSLADNHQDELAVAMSDMGYLRTCAAPDVAQCVSTLVVSELKPFPPPDPKKFSNILDEEMGFR